MNNKELPRECELKIRQHSYSIPFPSIGQMIDIETRKALFSKNQYSAMAQSTIISQQLALDLIDMASSFFILLPTLEQDLKVKLFDLGFVEGRDFLNAYKKQFLPWYTQWLEILSNPEIDDKKEEDHIDDGSGVQS